jgi:16S rRNA (cytosine967-C5)-methyltransferase
VSDLAESTDRQRPRRAGAPVVDAPRRVAYDLQRAVSQDGAYANLALPKLLAQRRLSGRDAAFATELGYGTARAAGTLDEIVAACADRPSVKIDPPVRDLLRLGAYQLLRTRVPAHAAVASTVELARSTGNSRSSGFLNAVLRKVAADDWTGWVNRLSADATPTRALALRYAHPEWIVRAFADALGDVVEGSGQRAGDDLAETERALAADDERPHTHLVAYPGRLSRDEVIAASGGTAGSWSPYAVHLAGGDPGGLSSIVSGHAGVQDEGSQLTAIALANAPLAGRDERWLDLCAGPGGKAALLAALAQPRGATLTANEVRKHRADLVAHATRHWPVTLLVEDARRLQPPDGTDGPDGLDGPVGYDRILLDAPCSGLGALRRRPEARWRRGPDDIAELVALQRELLAAALRLVRPGGLVAYVTCSPHRAETVEVVGGLDLIDARPLFAGVPDLGPGPTVQLWPHRHGTDAMFFALIRRAGTA